MKKIAIISDEHGCRRDQAVMKAFIAQNQDADYIIRNGDLFEGEEVSPFPSQYPQQNIIQEFNENVEYTNWFIDQFPSSTTFVHTLGNHPYRLKRLVQKAAPIAQLFDSFDLLHHHCQGERFVLVPDPLAPDHKVWRLTPRYDHFRERILYKPGINAYVVRIGKNCLVMHAAKSMKLSSSMARLWFFDFVLTRFPDARLVFQGHTHRQCDHIMGGFRYIETGCACLPGGYEEHFGRSGYPPIQRGWAECYYDPVTDLVDLNSARFIPFSNSHFFNPPII